MTLLAAGRTAGRLRQWIGARGARSCHELSLVSKRNHVNNYHKLNMLPICKSV